MRKGRRFSPSKYLLLTRSIELYLRREQLQQAVLITISVEHCPTLSCYKGFSTHTSLETKNFASTALLIPRTWQNKAWTLWYMPCMYLTVPYWKSFITLRYKDPYEHLPIWGYAARVVPDDDIPDAELDLRPITLLYIIGSVPTVGFF